MAQKLTAAFPPDFDLPANFVVQLTAVSPSTGAVVSGVNVSNAVIIADPTTLTASDGEPLFVPTAPEWINVPQTG